MEILRPQAFTFTGHSDLAAPDTWFERLNFKRLDRPDEDQLHSTIVSSGLTGSTLSGSMRVCKVHKQIGGPIYNGPPDGLRSPPCGRVNEVP